MPGSPGHGWFGSGVCDDPTTAGSAPACPACELKDAASVATAHVATAHLPREERGRYASWLGMGGLKLLETIVPNWVADAGHDAETFRRDNFGSDGSARTAGLAQNFAINLSGTLSGGARDTARFAAGAALAQLIQTVRPERMTREISPPARRPQSPLLPKFERVITGVATYYELPGNTTAGGAIFDAKALAAAMPDRALLGRRVLVQLLDNPNKSIWVTINDTGPWAIDPSGHAIRPVRPHPTHIIDLTPRAFMELTGGTLSRGVARVIVSIPAR